MVEKIPNPKINLDVANRIKSAIDARKLSYADVGRALGVTATSVWNWADANNSVSTKRLQELSEVLGVDPAWLAFGVSKQDDVVDTTDGGLVVIAEVSYTKNGGRSTLREWKISRKFVERTLRYSSESLILFENQASTVKGLEPGDFVVCTEEATDPRESGEGHYLVNTPSRPLVFFVSLISAFDIEYMTSAGPPLPEEVRAGTDMKILAKVVGSVHSGGSFD